MKELQRTWHIDVLHHSHTDIGYTARQELICRQHADFLRGAVGILRRIDAGEAEEQRGFRWQCENFWQVEQFLKGADDAERADLIRFAREGRIGLSASYLNLTDLIDDTVLREGLLELFTRDGYQVITAGNVREARERLAGDVQAIVMDVGLPDGDGVSLCREWRAAGETRPVLFLTARGEEFDVVRGLDSGGNDYVTKPFRMQELLSRVRVMLRNTQAAQPVSRSGFTVDRERMQVLKDGESLPLTLTEYKILTMLMDHPNVVPRERLLEVLWDDGGKFIDDNTLSVHMSRLRDKTGAEHIRTIRGVGYQWSDTSSAGSSC